MLEVTSEFFFVFFLSSNFLVSSAAFQVVITFIVLGVSHLFFSVIVFNSFSLIFASYFFNYSKMVSSFFSTNADQSSKRSF